MGRGNVAKIAKKPFWEEVSQSTPSPLLLPQAPSAMSAGEDAAWLRWVAKQFESIAGADRQIHLEQFKAALKVKEVSVPLCAGRLSPQLKGIKIGRQSSWCGVGWRERDLQVLWRNSKCAPPAPHISASSFPGRSPCHHPPAKSFLRSSLLLSVRHREHLLGNSHCWQRELCWQQQDSGHAEHPAATQSISPPRSPSSPSGSLRSSTRTGAGPSAWRSC